MYVTLTKRRPWILSQGIVSQFPD